MNSDRFRFFSSILKESDLLVGISHRCYDPGVEAQCRQEQSRLYQLISAHIKHDPDFATSLLPLPLPEKIPNLSPELKSMYSCGLATITGPMSAVAGQFAQACGRAIAKDNSCEVLVENGGDLYLRNRENMLVVIHAGEVELSGKLGLDIPPGEWGICTSSGTVGHSFSKGRADALTIVCKNTPLADAWATSLANQVVSKNDITPLLEKVAEIPEILACVVIVEGEVGIRGEFETKLLS